MPGLSNIPKSSADLFPGNLVGNLHPKARFVLLQKPRPGVSELRDNGPRNKSLFPLGVGRIVIIETALDGISEVCISGMAHLGPPSSKEDVGLLWALNATKHLVIFLDLLEPEPLVVVSRFDLSRSSVYRHVYGLDSKCLERVQAFCRGAYSKNKQYQLLRIRINVVKSNEEASITYHYECATVLDSWRPGTSNTCVSKRKRWDRLILEDKSGLRKSELVRHPQIVCVPKIVV